MKIITVANNKGGVSKTTLAKIIAEYFALKGQKVLLLDFDPQCNLSRRFLRMEQNNTFDSYGIWIPPIHPAFKENDEYWEGSDGRVSSATIFTEGWTEPYPTNYENISIIPGHGTDLDTVERIGSDEVEDKCVEVVKGWLELNNDEFNDHIVIIDTSPSRGPITRSAIRTATDVIIPAVMEEMCMEGVSNMYNIIRTENWSRKSNNRKSLNILGILPTQYDQRLGMHNDYRAGLQESEHYSQLIFQSLMHSWKDYKETSLAEPDGISIFDLPEKNKAKIEALSFCGELEERMNNET